MNEHPEASQYIELIKFHESKKLKSNDQRVALVDVDETICFYPGEKRRYDMAEPHRGNIAKINKLYDEDWYIIYWTARGGSDSSKKAGRCYWEFTNKQLKDWGCKFHELSTGSKGNYIKPPNDIVIDDKAVPIEHLGWEDLAPDICRQRAVIEGTLHVPFSPEDMTRYCHDITEVLKMTAVTSPVCNYDSRYGWCAYTHWTESGMHIYSWDDHNPPFFSVDIYTCKSFDPEVALAYTREFFGDNLIKLVCKD